MIPWGKNGRYSNVTPEEMKEIYRKLQTPVKCGPVMKLEDKFTDSPSVFRWKGHYCMYFITFAKDCAASGYETHLAVSRDLRHWEDMGPVLERNDDQKWDSRQIAGYAAFMPIAYEGSYELGQVGGECCLFYLGGSQGVQQIKSLEQAKVS